MRVSLITSEPIIRLISIYYQIKGLKLYYVPVQNSCGLKLAPHQISPQKQRKVKKQ